jgi:ABC-type spermidine/putrescine transport system permease subunit II
MTAAWRAIDVVVAVLSRLTIMLTALFLLVPAALVFVLSFSNDPAIRFPPASWGLREYHSFFHSGTWGPAVVQSLEVAVPAALLSVAIAVPAVLAFDRTRLPGRHALRFAGIAPLLIPQVAYAVAMYGIVAQLGLLGTQSGLILAHTAIAMPFVLVIAGATIVRLPKELDLVAMTLGASRLRAWVGITLRLLAPSIFAGFLFAFLTSFDDAVFVSFLSGPGLVTLPKAIFDSVRLGLDPAITAIAALLMAVTAVVLVAANWLRRT